MFISSPEFTARAFHSDKCSRMVTRCWKVDGTEGIVLAKGNMADDNFRYTGIQQAEKKPTPSNTLCKWKKQGLIYQHLQQ